MWDALGAAPRGRAHARPWCVHAALTGVEEDALSQDDHGAEHEPRLPQLDEGQQVHALVLQQAAGRRVPLEGREVGAVGREGVEERTVPCRLHRRQRCGQTNAAWHARQYPDKHRSRGAWAAGVRGLPGCGGSGAPTSASSSSVLIQPWSARMLRSERRWRSMPATMPGTPATVSCR
jgi:hypothetical protein